MINPRESSIGEDLVFEISSRCLDDNEKLNVMVQSEADRRNPPWFTFATNQEVQRGGVTEVVLREWTQGDKTLSLALDGDLPGSVFSFIEIYSERAGRVYRTASGGNGGFGFLRTRFPSNFAKKFLFRSFEH